MPVPGAHTPKVAVTFVVGDVSASVQSALAPLAAHAPPHVLNGIDPLLVACSVIGVWPYVPVHVAPHEITGVDSVSAIVPVPVLATTMSAVPTPVSCGATPP